MKRLLYVMLLSACAVVTTAQSGKGKRTSVSSRARMSQMSRVNKSQPVIIQEPVMALTPLAPLPEEAASSVKPTEFRPTMSGFDWFSSEPNDNVGNYVPPKESSKEGVSSSSLLTGSLEARKRFARLNKDIANETDPRRKADLVQRGQLLSQHINALENPSDSRKKFLQKNKAKLLAFAAAVAALGYAGHQAQEQGKFTELRKKLGLSPDEAQGSVVKKRDEEVLASELFDLEKQPMSGERFLELDHDSQMKVLHMFDTRYIHMNKRAAFLRFVESLTNALNTQNEKALLDHTQVPLDIEVVDYILNKIHVEKILPGADKRTRLRRGLRNVVGLTKNEAHKYFINIDADRQLFFLKRISHLAPELKQEYKEYINLDSEDYHRFVQNIIAGIGESNKKEITKRIKSIKVFDELMKRLGSDHKEVLEGFRSQYEPQSK